MGTFYEVSDRGSIRSTLPGSNIIVVTQVGDFPGGTGLGATISLAADTTYVIRGEVDILLDRIDVQNDNCAIIGHDRNKDILKASTLVPAANQGMITIGDPSLATYNEFNFTLDNLGLQCPNGHVLQAENIDTATSHPIPSSVFGRTKILQISNCEIRDSLRVFVIKGFELVDLINNLIWNINGNAATDGCRFQSCRHLEISSCEFFNWDVLDAANASRMVEIMPDLTDGNPQDLFNAVVNMNSCIIHPENNQVGLYIDSGSSTKFGTIASNTFISVNLNTPTGRLFDPLPAPDVADGYSTSQCLTYDVGLNQGIPNSTSHILVTFTGNTDDTDLATGVPAPVEQGTLALTRNAQRFTMAIVAFGTNDTPVITYNGTKNIYASISVSLSFDKQGGGLDSYIFSIHKDTGGGFVELPGSEINVDSGGDASELGVTLSYATGISSGDAFAVFCENPASGDDMLVKDFQWLIKE